MDDIIVNNRYKIAEKLNHKSKCDIYKGIDLKDKKVVAVKVYDLKSCLILKRKK